MVQDMCPPRAEPALSFTQGLIVGQLSVVLLVAAFIRFFIFGDPPSAEATASQRASERRARTEAHKTSLLTLRAQVPPAAATTGAGASAGASASASGPPPPPLSRLKSSVLRRPPVLTISSILNKTYYRVDSHQPESLDWFNVLIAQAIAQFRHDAQHDDAILASLTKALNGPSRPGFVDEIRVTELSLGEDFPIFSNCRIIPTDEDGLGYAASGDSVGSSGGGGGGGPTGATRLQARMDVDLSDMITLAVETKLLLNYPRRLAAVLPVALAVSVVRFSGTLSVSFVPSNPSQATPTKMMFAFLDDYRLDFSIRSLLGSRSRLQDVPKIAQLIESRLHRWFDERAVEPRFQEIALPSFWPRMRNTRGGPPPSEDAGVAAAAPPAVPAAAAAAAADGSAKAKPPPPPPPTSAAAAHARPESRDSRDSRDTRDMRDPRRDAETESWVDRQPFPLHAVPVAELSGQGQGQGQAPVHTGHVPRPSQEALRHRRRSRPDDAFSMPGSMPDLFIDPHS